MMGGYVLTIHTGENKIVALCDKENLGKKYEDAETGAVLDLSSKFYCGKEVTEEEAKEAVEGAYITNAVGEKSVKLLIRNKLSRESSVKRIDGVPYVQVLQA